MASGLGLSDRSVDHVVDHVYGEEGFRPDVMSRMLQQPQRFFYHPRRLERARRDGETEFLLRECYTPNRHYSVGEIVYLITEDREEEEIESRILAVEHFMGTDGKARYNLLVHLPPRREKPTQVS